MATQKRASKKSKTKLTARLVKRIHPDKREARDEGPRLIPLPSSVSADPQFSLHSRFLDLADIALGHKKKR
jgi:hypothetical protein